MILSDRQKEKNEACALRHELAAERIRLAEQEHTVSERYLSYFQRTARFLLLLEEVRVQAENEKLDTLSLAELQTMNRALYADILPENYAESFGNPAYAEAVFGSRTLGQLMSLLYAELRSGIPYAFEQRTDALTILYELFIEIYNCFEDEAAQSRAADAAEAGAGGSEADTAATSADGQTADSAETGTAGQPADTDEIRAAGSAADAAEMADDRELTRRVRDILYWYASDYADVFLAERILEQIDPSYSFAADIIEGADLDDDRYLYRFGEYISENELGTARHLRELSEETIRKMADSYTEGYRIGFINTGKDLSIKSTVNIRYTLGFERVIRRAIENFREMGLEPVIYRAAGSVITKREHHRIGYFGGIPNKQYDYDHRQDQALIMDRRYVERKLEVMGTVYEQNKEAAAGLAGPAVMETFGEHPFSPAANASAPVYSAMQQTLAVSYDSRSGQLTDQYIRGDERSFTIVAYPVPEIDTRYPEIFDEIVRINTLDAKLYEQVQQTLIDALNQGKYVRVKGKAPNRTDMKVMLYRLADAEKETIFENCVADVNIPVGEVFTSPVLEGTAGVLHVGSVYLDGLNYKNLCITFRDGKIADYTCENFSAEAENRAYIRENVLKNHDTLPIGEFAIGTNTQAYVTARKYGIEDKMPILIAEKTGPHFAVGDTCYSRTEDIRVYNPDGREIVAKDNSVSIQRKTDSEKAYLNCHTDITIPYDELQEIAVVTNDEKDIILLRDGRFVLPGTEVLNAPLDGEVM